MKDPNESAKLEPDTPPVRPIGRGRKVRAAVLAATLDELRLVGYAALTVDNVARRARVHKTTVYRRWRDRESLVADALTANVELAVPNPDTGAIETDLRELASALIRSLTSPAGESIIAAVLSDAARVPEIAGIKSRFFEDRFRRHEPVVIRAIERGQLPPRTDPAEVIKALIAPIYLALLVTAEPVDDSTAERAARIAVAAARAGALNSTRRTPSAS